MSNLPQNASIIEAKLSMRMGYPLFGSNAEFLEPGTLYVHSITKSWSETTAFWNTIATEVSQPAVGSLPFSGDYYVWYEFDLNMSTISDLANGFMVTIDTNIVDTISGAALRFHSSEDSYAGYHPKLYIKYQN